VATRGSKTPARPAKKPARKVKRAAKADAAAKKGKRAKGKKKSLAKIGRKAAAEATKPGRVRRPKSNDHDSGWA
jgi:hypothetical protein